MFTVPHAAWFAALVGASLMLLVMGAYVLAARRVQVLFHPVAIILAVTGVGVLVSVLGELARNGWAGVPAMALRSSIGSAGWGVIFAGAVWGVRRGLRNWS